MYVSIKISVLFSMQFSGYLAYICLKIFSSEIQLGGCEERAQPGDQLSERRGCRDLHVPHISLLPHRAPPLHPGQLLSAVTSSAML